MTTYEGRAIGAAGDTAFQSRAVRLDRALAELLSQAPELEAAAVVSFDGLAMASILPPGMDEDRVAAMSAALLSLGEKAAEGLGRGDLSQVYIEGETGTVFLISAKDEAVLVAVAAKGAKAGLMMFEVRRSAAAIGDVLAAEPAQRPSWEDPIYDQELDTSSVVDHVAEPVIEPIVESVIDDQSYVAPVTALPAVHPIVEPLPSSAVFVPSQSAGLAATPAAPATIAAAYTGAMGLPEAFAAGPEVLHDQPPTAVPSSWAPYAGPGAGWS